MSNSYRRDSDRSRVYDAEAIANLTYTDERTLSSDEASDLVARALTFLDSEGFTNAHIAATEVKLEYLDRKRYAVATSWKERGLIKFYGLPSHSTVLHEVAHLRVPSCNPGHGIMFRHLSLLLRRKFAGEEAHGRLRLAYDHKKLRYDFDTEYAKKIRARGVWLYNRGVRLYGNEHLRMSVVMAPIQNVDTGEITTPQFTGPARVESKVGVIFKERGLSADGAASPLVIPWDQIAYVDGWV